MHGLHNWPDVFGSDFSQLYVFWEQQNKYFVVILFLIYYTAENRIHNMAKNKYCIATLIGLLLQLVNTTEFCDQKELYLGLGSKGLVSCDFGEFGVVGWLIGEDVDDRSPTIFVENSRIQGPGYENGEYDMFQNGSLIINKVSLQHEQMLTARIVKGLDVEHYTIEVKVYVLPVPVYPVVNGLTNQQRVVIYDYSGGQVNCTMDRVRPNIELELVFLDHVPQDVSLSSIHSSVNNTDGTYNVCLVSNLTVGSNLIGRLTLQCRVAGQMANYFPAVTLIDVLLLSTNFPVVNGSNGEPHVVRYVEREVYLTCAMDKALPNISLEWVIVTPALSNQMLQEQTSSPTRDQVDGAVTINRKLWLRFPPDAIYARLECRLWIGREIVRATTVELIIKDGFWQSYPTVNGLTNEQRVILDINREDELTCTWNGVPKYGYLKWDIINPSSDGIIMTDHYSHTRDNGDGTYDLSLHSTLSVHDPSVLRVTLHCKVAAPADQWYPEITTAELLLPANSFPVINGLTSQQHVVLDVQRTDELTCSMHRVSQEVSLRWFIITPDSSEDISLDDQLSRSNNKDGTVNITLNSTVTVTSLSINRVTLQCKVSRLSTDSPQVSSTQVELLLPSNCKEDLQTNKILLGLVIGIFIMVFIILLFSFNICKVQRQYRYKHKRKSQAV